MAIFPRAAKQGGGSNGGVSRSGLVLPFLSFFVLLCPSLSFFVLFGLFGLSRFFHDFPDLLGDGPGIFSIRPFPLSRPINSAYSPERVRDAADAIWTFPEKSGNPAVWKPPGLASPNFHGYYFRFCIVFYSPLKAIS